MKVLTLPAETREQLGFTHKAIIKYSDLTAAAANQTFNLVPTVANTTMATNRVVTKTAMRLVTPFTGGAIVSATLDLGDVGSASRYIAAAATDLFTALAANQKNNVIGTTPYAYAGADAAANAQITAKISTGGANVNAATAGELEIYLKIEDWTPLTMPQ